MHKKVIVDVERFMDIYGSYEKANIKKDNPHYDIGEISVIEILIRKYSKEWFIGHCVQTCDAYHFRCNHKGTREEDLKKASDYAKWAYKASMIKDEDWSDYKTTVKEVLV